MTGLYLGLGTRFPGPGSPTVYVLRTIDGERVGKVTVRASVFPDRRPDFPMVADLEFDDGRTRRFTDNRTRKAVLDALAAALTAAGWRRDPANIEGEYVEGDWVLDNVGPGPLAYSIEPSGHHRSVIVHRGAVGNSPVFAINQHGTRRIPSAVVLAAVDALIAEDRGPLRPPPSYKPKDRVILERPGSDPVTGTIVKLVERTNTEIPGGTEDVYSVLVDGETEPRLWGTGWMQDPR